MFPCRMMAVSQEVKIEMELATQQKSVVPGMEQQVDPVQMGMGSVVLVSNRLYPLRGYILGVLKHITA